MCLSKGLYQLDLSITLAMVTISDMILSCPWFYFLFLIRERDFSIFILIIGTGCGAATENLQTCYVDRYVHHFMDFIEIDLMGNYFTAHYF